MNQSSTSLNSKPWDSLTEREKIQYAFIRVARDVKFAWDAPQVAHFVAGMLKISALEVWIAFGNTVIMAEIADGTHPCLELERYKT